MFNQTTRHTNNTLLLNTYVFTKITCGIKSIEHLFLQGLSDE